MHVCEQTCYVFVVGTPCHRLGKSVGQPSTTKCLLRLERRRRGHRQFILSFLDDQTTLIDLDLAGGGLGMRHLVQAADAAIGRRTESDLSDSTFFLRTNLEGGCSPPVASTRFLFHSFVTITPFEFWVLSFKPPVFSLRMLHVPT